MKTYAQVKTNLFQDKEIKKAYNELGPEFELIGTLIHKRLAKGLTQGELARRIGTKQSAVSRLESGRYNPSLAILRKVAKALDADLKISIR